MTTQSPPFRLLPSVDRLLKLQEGEPPADAFTLPDVAGVGVVPGLATGSKCARCWQVLPEVGRSSQHPDLCHRCEDAVGTVPRAA